MFLKGAKFKIIGGKFEKSAKFKIISGKFEQSAKFKSKNVKKARKFKKYENLFRKKVYLLSMYRKWQP